MKPLSIGKAWEETVAFVKREGALLFPVAFVFLALPSVLVQQFVPPQFIAYMAAIQAGTKNVPVPVLPASFIAAVLLAIALILTGALALYALSLRGGISVREAMVLAFRRLPVLLAAALLIMAGGVGVVILLSIIGAVTHVAGGAGAMVALINILVPAVMLFVGVRLLLLYALTADRTVGPVDAIRQSWALSRGHFLRLFAFFMVFLIVTLVVQAAAEAVFGIIGRLAGGVGLAVLLGGIAVAALSAVIQVYFIVMTGRLYRQLEASA